MRVAWLTAETPDVRGGGGQRRQFHQIRVLASRSFDVTVFSVAGPQSDESVREFASVHRFAGRRRFRGGLGPGALARFDAAVVAHVESVRHFHRPLRSGPRYAVDFHNVYSRWYGQRGAAADAGRWAATERRTSAAASACFACSAEEAEALRAAAPGARVSVLANGISPDEWPEPRAERSQTIAMFGAWDHVPNREGVLWFGKRVWPHILRRVPSARAVLFGPGTPPTFPGISHAGWVSCLPDALGSVRVVIVPIHQGMGSRVKFGEALASGAAVVSTTEGAEGFEATGCYICADDEVSFADSCVRLLEDEEHARFLGARGRELALSQLAWDVTTLPLIDWLAECS